MSKFRPRLGRLTVFQFDFHTFNVRSGRGQYRALSSVFLALKKVSPAFRFLFPASACNMQTRHSSRSRDDSTGVDFSGDCSSAVMENK